MTGKKSERPTWNTILSQALRILRRARLMRARDVAAAMALPRRTYEYFEAGEGQISLERIHKFSAALKADGHAILAGMMIGSPRVALRAADNRLMTAFLIALEEFDEAAGDDMQLLDPTEFMQAFSDSFDRLLAEAKQKAGLRAKLGTNISNTNAPSLDGDGVTGD